jgi:hypothetical protein
MLAQHLAAQVLLVVRNLADPGPAILSAGAWVPAAPHRRQQGRHAQAHPCAQGFDVANLFPHQATRHRGQYKKKIAGSACHRGQQNKQIAGSTHRCGQQKQQIACSRIAAAAASPLPHQQQQLVLCPNICQPMVLLDKN